MRLHAGMLEIGFLLWPCAFHPPPVWLFLLPFLFVLEVREPAVWLLVVIIIGMLRLVSLLVIAEVVVIHLIVLWEMELVWCWHDLLRRRFVGVVVVHPLHEVHRLIVRFLFCRVLYLNIDQIIGRKDPGSLTAVVHLWEVNLRFVRSVLYRYARVVAGVYLVHGSRTALLSLRLGPCKLVLIVAGLKRWLKILSLASLGDVRRLHNYFICIKRHLWVDVVLGVNLILVPIRHRLVLRIINIIIAFIRHLYMAPLRHLILDVTKVLLANKLDVSLRKVFGGWLVARVGVRMAELIHVLIWRFVAILPRLWSYTY